MRQLPPGWSADRSQGYLQYVRADGARVYQHIRPSWGPAIWGAQVPGWPRGSEISTTRAGAIAYVERHYPLKEQK
ncbi:MAG TPA: hypothetical protein PLL30_16960 [Candidatus Krumholzibacteria bacterium]|nr:hypothetical protein [Verrucomicrobiota bacterium]HPD73465.1 hypothetical protein [Candidatus Krumholzibacteria bacterium]HRY42188.1 hypothetical protein [Candidatus Krumholzibacteria bacterium]